MHRILIALGVFLLIIGGALPPKGKEADTVHAEAVNVSSASHKVDTEKPAEAESIEEVKEEPAKETTWQDNPNNCDQSKQYISAEPPYECLDKPKAQTSTQTQPSSTTPARSPITGNKHDWLRASGIPESEWTYVDYIVSRESGWNPCAYNPGRSDCNANPTSACGLAQSLPCGKQSKYGHWTDPVANLKWQYEYVKGRYGGYAQAYNFWVANHWY